MSITENQKRLYNLHLQISRRHQEKPYRLRENFDNFAKEKPEEYLWLQKLDAFLTIHPQINVKLFFTAPYHIYDDQDYFSLNYFVSQSAIKAYTLYLKEIHDQSPDSPFQLEFIKDSLTFLKDYCIEQKIDLLQYLNKMEGITYMWTVHLAEHKISPYIIIGLKYFQLPVHDLIFSIPDDEREMLIADLAKAYLLYTTRLDNSTQAKKLTIEGIKIISQHITKHLQSTMNVVK